MMPEYYEFQHSTKILSGKQALENIPAELHALEASRPMVLSDAVLKKIGTTDLVCDAVQQDRKSTRLNSSHITRSRMPSSA